MRVLKFLAALIVLVVVIGAAFLYRPWSDYNPADKYAAFGLENAFYNHRHMDELFEHEVVTAAAPKPLPTGNAIVLPKSFELNGETVEMAEHLSRFGVQGLVVVKDGAIVLQEYYEGGDAQSHFTSWSAAKSFVGTLVGMAVHKGLIQSIDDPVTQYLPHLQGTAYEGASIRNVMNMSSGMGIDGLNPEGGMQDTMDMMQDWMLWHTPFSAHLGAFPSAAQPGTKWNYNNLDSHVLALLVEKVSGQRFAQTVSEWMWTPLNAAQDATWLLNREGGEALGFCCLQASGQDYARLGLLMLNDGVWNGTRLLPEGWVADVASVEDAHLKLDTSNYQLQWWLDPNRPGQFSAKGRWGQAVYVSQPDNVVVVRFSIDPEEMSHGEEQWAADAAIARHAAQQ